MKRTLLAISIFATLSVLFGNVTLAKEIKAAKAPATKAAKKPADAPEYFENVQLYPGASPVPVVAKQAILIDFKTGKVLLEKNADERMAPSSMTKMMTTYIMEEKILKGEISNETEFLVSEKAWRTQGSKMFVHVGNKVKVADLHKGIAIQSGNDASIVAAEGILGSEEAFAAEMNLTAEKLGLTATHFKNASGLHEEGHYSTARDLAKLGVAVIRDHAQFYSVNQERDFTYNGIKQGNRNPLLYDNIGCDGIKTGHTDAGGFGVTASCLDQEQRYILVVNGLPSMQARADEARKLMGWAKGNFLGKTIVKQGDIIEPAVKITHGVKDTVAAVAAKDVNTIMLRSEQSKVQTTKTLNADLVAPIHKGQRIGVMKATVGDTIVEVDLLAAESIEKLSWFKRALKYIGL